MPGDIDKINEIFRIQDEATAAEASADSGETAKRGGRADLAKYKNASLKAVDNLLIDKSGSEVPNYTGDETSERDYRPVRQSHEYKSGCLGGIMYFVFIACVSVVFACLAWMAASDMLALNKDDFTATINLPASVFQSETVDVFDDNGKKTGSERVSHADIDYVADELKNSGLIEYRWLFEFFCKISNADKKIRPGEYELKSSFDYRALVQNMRPGSGSALTVDVTIPEGFTMHQIFMRLEDNGVCSYEDLMSAAAEYKYNYSFLEGLEEGQSTRLEGYLFPDTYQFYVGMQASSALNKFLNTFYGKLTPEMLQAAEDKGMTLAEIINIASLIEKEAANDAERPFIASVIYNRLNAGMQLGIDASILYVHPDHEGAPNAEMLAEDSPYNTRKYVGLPPTPISNPGLPSIFAALNPEHTNYFYYALDTETNEHRFFESESEFNSFVATQNYE